MSEKSKAYIGQEQGVCSATSTVEIYGPGESSEEPEITLQFDMDDWVIVSAK